MRMKSGIRDKSIIVVVCATLTVFGCKDNVIVDGGPHLGTWEQVAPMNIARREHSAVLLKDGRVLISGGNAFDGRISSGIRSCELYSPIVNSWVMTDSMPFEMWRHQSVLLNNGKVFVAENKQHGMLYDPTTGRWNRTPAPYSAEDELTATLLKNGKVLITGGSNLKSTAMYDPGSDGWSSSGDFLTGRIGHTATLLNTGKVLVAGGIDSAGNLLRECELFDPLTESWTRTDSTRIPRGRHTSTLLGSGKVLVTGGFDPGLKSCEVFDPDSGRWQLVAPMFTSKAFHTAVSLRSGEVLILPEYDWQGEIYNEWSNSWTQIQPPARQRGWIAATILSSGRVLVSGGLYYSWADNHYVTIPRADVFTP